MLRSLAASLALAVVAVPVQAQLKPGAVVRSEVPGEIVVCFRSAVNAPAIDMDETIAQWNLAKAEAPIALSGAKPLMRWQRPGENFMTNVVVMNVAGGNGGKAGSAAIIAALQSQPNVIWAAPNYVYTGDVKDATPNDPQYGGQYHHPLMQNNLAWDTTFGSPSVIIAVTDDGVSIPHADLAPNIWINADEIAGNAIDDDGNGYIDDVNGWDFSSGNNDPNPDGGDSHGTHVAGIAAGRTNNAIGIAGTAGNATIMPVQFYGVGAWTSVVIANSFNYATNNGAKIISTSYNIDGWVGDATVIAAFDYLYDNGVLHLNSAGNNSSLNPPRQAFHQTLLVASTDSADVKSGFSNWGTGVDISAPGSDILSTLPGNAYGLNSGTSMATPNAAGVAALIWSAHPTWTRDQVAAQLVATANNINAQNPAYANLLGGGRANSFQAVTATSIPAPRILATTGVPANNGSVATIGTGMRLRFNQVMSPASVNAPGAFAFEYAGVDGVFGNGDDAAIPVTTALYKMSSNEAVLTVSNGSIVCGRYRLTANADVLENPFGTNLDGDGNGSGGDSWQSTFTIEPCAGDVTCDSQVNVGDLLAVITAWGASPGGRADVNSDGTVNVSDLLTVITAWGPCVPPVVNNDTCQSPAVLGIGSFAFDNTGTTNSGPTPVGCTATFGSDIWIRFTPPASGTATFDTCTGTTFDSYLLAYSGTCDTLTQIACDDDTCGTSGTRSRISFAVTSGQPVLVRLGGWNSAQGTGTLIISMQ